MTDGIPGLAGTDHVGFTVPDIEAATEFFVDVIGCKVIYQIGPFQAEDDWMKVHLNVDPRAAIPVIRMLKCRNGPAFEIFEYSFKGANQAPPRNSDVGGHHLAFYVQNMDAAMKYLHEKGVEIQGDPTTMTEGPTAGFTWVYFLTPWGMQLEMVSYPNDLAYEDGAAEILWNPSKC